MKRILVALCVLLPTLAYTQSAPQWQYGYFPSPEEWTGWFARKQDVTNAASVLTYGAKCDGVTDDTSALQAALTASAALGRTALAIPQGRCVISSALSVSLGAGQSISLRGPGAGGGIVSTNGSGLTVTMTDTTSGFDASDLTFFHAASTQSGTGLTVQSTAGQTVPSRFSNLVFIGPTPAASWQIGLHLISLSSPVIDGVRTLQADALGAGSGYGIEITGTDNSHFAIDTKIVGAVLQGGHVGIMIDGSVQGVFVTNSDAIGNDHGIYATDPSGTHYGELVSVTTSHFNTVLSGVTFDHFNQSMVSNTLFLHFGAAAGITYNAINSTNSGYIGAVNNVVNGAGVGSETFFRASGGTSFTVSANNVTFLAGDCVNADSTTTYVVVSGNSCGGVSPLGIVIPSTGDANAVGNVINGASYTDNVSPRLPNTFNVGSSANQYANVFTKNVAIGVPGSYSILTSDGANGFNITGALKSGPAALTPSGSDWSVSNNLNIGNVLNLPDGHGVCWSNGFLCMTVQAAQHKVLFYLPAGAPDNPVGGGQIYGIMSINTQTRNMTIGGTLTQNQNP